MTIAIDLTGRTILITGASSGLGERFARIAHAAGAKVIATARRTDRLQAFADDLGERLLPVAMDVADEASTIAAFNIAEAHFGPVHSVVANAGTSIEGPVLNFSLADFDAVMAVNLRGCFLTAREAARRMIASGQQDGRIVVISSITAVQASPGLAAYTASKAAVSAMGKVMAREWLRQGVAVNMIAPGYIRTEINSDWFDTEAGAKQIARFPRRRLLPAEELDPLLLYLASDACKGVTGAVFTVDDGQTL